MNIGKQKTKKKEKDTDHGIDSVPGVEEKHIFPKQRRHRKVTDKYTGEWVDTGIDVTKEIRIKDGTR